MHRARRVKVAAAGTAIAGGAVVTYRVIVHDEGQQLGWRFFVGLALFVVGAIIYGQALQMAASDREAVYRLGHAAGRLDALREMNRLAPVVPLHPAENGLHSFNRQARSGAGRRARPSRLERAQGERAGSPG